MCTHTQIFTGKKFKITICKYTEGSKFVQKKVLNAQLNKHYYSSEINLIKLKSEFFT